MGYKFGNPDILKQIKKYLDNPDRPEYYDEVSKCIASDVKYYFNYNTNWGFSSTDVDDITQDVQLKVYKKLYEFYNKTEEYGYSGISWLITIITNTAKDWIDKYGKDRGNTSIDELSENGMVDSFLYNQNKTVKKEADPEEIVVSRMQMKEAVGKICKKCKDPDKLMVFLLNMSSKAERDSNKGDVLEAEKLCNGHTYKVVYEILAFKIKNLLKLESADDILKPLLDMVEPLENEIIHIDKKKITRICDDLRRKLKF